MVCLPPLPLLALQQQPCTLGRAGPRICCEGASLHGP